MSQAIMELKAIFPDGELMGRLADLSSNSRTFAAAPITVLA